MKNGEVNPEEKGNHFHRYLNYAEAILQEYNGAEPFHLFIRKYFSANKKHGSKDRRIIASLCYDYFRVSHAVSPSVDLKAKLLLATFLVERKPSLILQNLKPTWNNLIHLDIQSKIEKVKDVFFQKNIFPFPDELSEELNFEKFSLSFLIQPKLFIRIRPGNEDAVLDELISANIPFEKVKENCLAFPNNEKLSELINIDKEAVIQDLNSQQTLIPLLSNLKDPAHNFFVWDCCAASGGKSILAFDLLKNVQLTVSDTRKNILDNLKNRFIEAGIKNYYSFVADLSTPVPENFLQKQDIIIADVPCSGSGTWSRTPEQLHFFQRQKIMDYSDLQKKIVKNAVKFLKENGFLLYITCSVFEKENEENLHFFQSDLKLELVQSQYFKGYELQADTLFSALLKFKP